MKLQTIILLVAVILAEAHTASGKDLLDCAKKSLAAAIENAKPGDAISFTGTCAGPVVIRTGPLALMGEGLAVVDGASQDAIVIDGAHGISLTVSRCETAATEFSARTAPVLR